MLSRREFLRAGLTVAAGALVGGAVLGQTPEVDDRPVVAEGRLILRLHVDPDYESDDSVLSIDGKYRATVLPIILWDDDVQV